MLSALRAAAGPSDEEGGVRFWGSGELEGPTMVGMVGMAAARRRLRGGGVGGWERGDGGFVLRAGGLGRESGGFGGEGRGVGLVFWRAVGEGSGFKGPAVVGEARGRWRKFEPVEIGSGRWTGVSYFEICIFESVLVLRGRCVWDSVVAAGWCVGDSPRGTCSVVVGFCWIGSGEDSGAATAGPPQRQR